MHTISFTDGSTLSVSYEGDDYSPSDGDTRPAYTTTISTPEWEYQDNTMRGPVGGESDEKVMISTAASFLLACAEAHNHPGSSDNRDLFPPHVAEWADSVSDELSMLSADE